MTTLLFTFLFSTVPDLTELHRFPRLEAANARIGILIEQRYRSRLQFGVDRKNAERWAEALRENGRHLAAWEALLEARGGLAEEAGFAVDDTCRRALQRLRSLLGEARWAAGEMP
jgi:hypothetical protein